MPTAHEVATELRRIADLFDQHGDKQIKRPDLWWWARDKDEFLSIVEVFPRPFAKRVSHPDSNYPDLIIEHLTDVLRVEARVSRSSMCKLVTPAQPAVYECEPLLSAEEEQSLETA